MAWVAAGTTGLSRASVIIWRRPRCGVPRHRRLQPPRPRRGGSPAAGDVTLPLVRLHEPRRGASRWRAGPAVLLPDAAGGGQSCPGRRVAIRASTSRVRTRCVPRGRRATQVRFGRRRRRLPRRGSVPPGVDTQEGPRYSVVIPAFNEQADLGACLASLAAQDYLDAFEIIVVDNNSTTRRRSTGRSCRSAGRTAE